MDTYRQLCLNVPKEYEALRSSAHRFAKEVMRPAAIELDRMADPNDAIAPGSPLRQVLKKAYQMGFHVAGIPVAMGGLGLDPLATHILHEELAWGSVDLALAIGCAGFPAFVAAQSGNPELYEAFVKPYVEDREATFIGCWAITEPNHGSDHVMVGTPEFHNPKVTGEVVARADGDSYVISGQKSSWVSNGTIATHAALYLRIHQPGVKGMAGGGVAVVPLNLTGVSKGKPLNKLGQRALNQGEIFFENVRIPRHYMVIDAGGYEQQNHCNVDLCKRRDVDRLHWSCSCCLRSCTGVLKREGPGWQAYLRASARSKASVRNVHQGGGVSGAFARGYGVQQHLCSTVA